MTQAEDNNTLKIRKAFQEVVRFFPELTFSLTYCEQPKLNILDQRGEKFSLALNLLEKSDILVQETIFSIKERLRIFDA